MAAPCGTTLAGARAEDTCRGGERARVQRLERALIAALRENATNWARAERAEQLLGERAAASLADRG